jgi:hypothetical protein
MSCVCCRNRSSELTYEMQHYLVCRRSKKCETLTSSNRPPIIHNGRLNGPWTKRSELQPILTVRLIGMLEVAVSRLFLFMFGVVRRRCYWSRW